MAARMIEVKAWVQFFGSLPEAPVEFKEGAVGVRLGETLEEIAQLITRFGNLPRGIEPVLEALRALELAPDELATKILEGLMTDDLSIAWGMMDDMPQGEAGGGSWNDWGMSIATQLGRLAMHLYVVRVGVGKEVRGS